MTTINQGNTYIIEVLVKDQDGNPKDLTSTQEVQYTMAKSVNSALPYFTKDLTSPDVTIPDPVGGVVNVKLQNDDTENLTEGQSYHELVLKDAVGNVSTLICEYISISKKLLNNP